ncbi:hypothetical protein GGTG_13575 [Gaeumannomyces tritici R3-111a-1]|uniref:Integral membrane protein n=1 Tax=Gaeumannomyces tritici (strain R3-111a-1) TaxID=644352 RepID=J3PJ94_GAET3|nr:hypothetical protein GGTG_13575 [Gaeumannomyces tritici R3-111a-1]EJT68866.1 hypothetical protein GGTG_13575 [Gaeumannomyces tritici R3-111a-1]
MSPLSQSPLLQWAAYAFGGIVTGFGVNAMVRPAHALTFFGFAPPKAPSDRRVVDGLVAVYGARDVFMGAAVFAAGLNGHASTLGWLLLAIGAVAAVDGLVCRAHGTGSNGATGVI